MDRYTSGVKAQEDERMAEFYETRMGHEFYKSTMPRLVRAIERLNELLEKVVEQTAAASTRGETGSTTAHEKASP